LSLALSANSPPIAPASGVESFLQRPADVSASQTQSAPPAATDSATDSRSSTDPYAQIDALLAGLRDLTLGGASLKSASTAAQANAAYFDHTKD
jgi:hypothetical protein